jgi:hypothetical protein
MGVQDNGRAPTILTDEEIDQINVRHSVVPCWDRGVALIGDDLTGELTTFTKFKRAHGVRGELWLQSDRKRMSSLEAFQANQRRRAIR